MVFMWIYMILNELEAFLILFSCYTVDQLPVLSSVLPFLFSFSSPTFVFLSLLFYFVRQLA